MPTLLAEQGIRAELPLKGARQFWGHIVRCNRKQLANILGRDVKTIDKMVAQGMPYESRPGGGSRSWVFNPAAILRWMMRDQFAEQTKKHRSRMLEAKAGLKFLEYVERLGLVVRKHEITDRMMAGDAIVVSRLKAMPQRLAHIVAQESDPEIIAKLIDKELDGVLEQLDKPWDERG